MSEQLTCPKCQSPKINRLTMIQEPGEGKQPITLKTDEIYLLDNEFGQLGIGNNLTYFMIDLYICEQKHHFAIVTQKIYSLEGDKYTEDLV